MLSVNSFFSGIGGFDLAFQSMGFEIKYQCEINDFCNSILSKNWPNISRHKDITKVKAKDIPKADVWCAGFPCQDVSVARGANGRDGLKGKNSGLFYDFLELVKAKKPETILIENVTGLLNSHNGNDFKIVVESLTSLGYGVSWRVLNTRYFGAPQSRPRVYICAWKNNIEKAVYVLHEVDKSVKQSNPREGFLTPHKKVESGITVPEVAYCLAATSGRHTGTDWSRTYISYFDKVRRLTPTEAERLQGFPTNWTVPSSSLTTKEIFDLDTERYHAIGNAVSVPVVVWIANRIKAIKTEKTLYRGLQPLAKKFGDFGENIRVQFFTLLNSTTLFPAETNPKISWNTGGFAFKDEVIDCKVYNCPTFPFETKLVDFIDDEPVDTKYFLSPSAATGILRRVDSQGRKLFDPLMKSLIRLSRKHHISSQNQVIS